MSKETTMTDWVNPEDVFAVLATTFPHIPIAAWIATVVAAVLLLSELSMRFGFGGVPDGLLGMLSLAAFGVALLIWAGTWPAGCGGTIVLAGLTAIGIALLVGSIIVVFWRSRQNDGGMLVRGYGDQSLPGQHDGSYRGENGGTGA